MKVFCHVRKKYHYCLLLFIFRSNYVLLCLVLVRLKWLHRTRNDKKSSDHSFRHSNFVSLNHIKNSHEKKNCSKIKLYTIGIHILMHIFNKIYGYHNEENDTHKLTKFIKVFVSIVCCKCKSFHVSKNTVTVLIGQKCFECSCV